MMSVNSTAEGNDEVELFFNLKVKIVVNAWYIFLYKPFWKNNLKII